LAPAFYIVLLFAFGAEHLGVSSSAEVMTACAWASVVVPITAESLLVFYVTRVLLSRISPRPNQALQPTAGRSND
ncbi:MAG: hypothetical protein ACREFF_12270, partial [Candidatus Udaeobacter sp.]